MKNKKGGISKLTIFLGAFIIISASFTRQITNFLISCFGKKTTVISVNAVLIGTAAIALVFIIRKNRKRLLRIAGLIGLLVVAILFVFHMKNFIERVHILDYAVLGWLTGRDLLKKTRPISIVAALIFCSTVGILDELFQLCLPYRVCDWRDMVFNSLGASLGIILWLINNR